MSQPIAAMTEEKPHPDRPPKQRFATLPDYFSNASGSASGSFDGDEQLTMARKSAIIGRENPMVSSIEKLAQKRGTNTVMERFKVMPDYAYPNTKMNREELRREMNKKSFYFHELRLASEPRGVGQVALEIMQCFGLPKPDSTLGSEASAFCIAVSGSHAFRTDTMPPVGNPMWLSRMRRACIFPVLHAYARVYIGVFGQNPEGRKDGFAGRIVLDLSRFRPNCTYDITLPLRQSAHAYSRSQRGAIRIRVHLDWHSERQAILSYLPRQMPKFTPQDDVAVHCCDTKSFQNVARVVHGEHMPGRFSTKQFRATAKEVQLTQIYLLRYMRKKELRNLRQWRVPVISAFLFGAWMHCVHTASVKYVPGHFITLLLLYLWKNYAFYRVQRAPQNGFIGPSWEEMFFALLFGRPNSIKPLQMQVSETYEKTVMDDMAAVDGSESGGLALVEIAKIFRAEMKLHTGRQHLRVFQDVFKGSEAVDFLVDKGFADSRDVAVEIGRRLEKDLKLFECVMSTYDFMDEPWLYHFGNYDPNKYVIDSYKPKGKRFFRFLGLIPGREPTYAESQLEMPYASPFDHPRFTVKESLVIRSKESMKMMEDEQEDFNKDNAKSQSQQIAAGLDMLMDDDEKTQANTSLDDMELTLEEDPTKEVKILAKPPQQDINFKPKKKGKPLPDVLAEARYKVHRLMLHAFNDRVYTTNTKVVSQTARQSNCSIRKRKIRNFLSRKNISVEQDDDPKQEKTNPKKICDEYDKLLGIGKYSHPNPWISRVGVLVQPIVEIVLGVLCMFRAVFNIFTWRDPILTFWLSILGPALVIVLHFFPWRLVLGIVGVVLFGPQNWIIRVRRERMYGPDEFDPDKIVKKRKSEKEPEDTEVPLFSMYAPDNQPISNDDIASHCVRRVLVPYSPLMYQRFYDFPPETEYARVVADEAPTVDQLDAARIASDLSLDSSHSTGRRRGFKRIRRGFRRRGRRQDTMSSEGSNQSSAK